MRAILILKEMPTGCIDCPCYYEDRNKCQNTWDRVDDDTVRPSWCPLKPMPKRMLEVAQLQYERIVNIQKIQFAKGWNACLKEITDHIGESTEKTRNDDLYESWMFFDEGETE